MLQDLSASRLRLMTCSVLSSLSRCYGPHALDLPLDFVSVDERTDQVLHRRLAEAEFRLASVLSSARAFWNVTGVLGQPLYQDHCQNDQVVLELLVDHVILSALW